jgi:hypothetical protein
LESATPMRFPGPRMGTFAFYLVTTVWMTVRREEGTPLSSKRSHYSLLPVCARPFWRLASSVTRSIDNVRLTPVHPL